MLRKVGLIALIAVLAAGCGERGYRNGAPPLPAPYLADLKSGGPGPTFGYTHSLGLLLPQGGVKASFEQARSACLKKAALQCDLVSASLSSGEDTVSAMLIAALPHDQVPAFEKILTDAGAKIQSRSSNAENVTAVASDTDRKVAQLTAWRDRLALLAKRNDLSVSDLMKVEAELSKVEADLGAALAEKRDLTGRIGKEIVTVSFGEAQGAWSPVAHVFATAGDTLIESAAAAIEFLIRIVPWLPLILAGLWLLRWLWSKRKKMA